LVLTMSKGQNSITLLLQMFIVGIHRLGKAEKLISPEEICPSIFYLDKGILVFA